jgi:hypothetical protein
VFPGAAHARLLKRAIEICGGWNALCARLGVSDDRLAAWLEGKAQLPQPVLLNVADIILEDDLAWAAQDRRSEPRYAVPRADPTGQSRL